MYSEDKVMTILPGTNLEIEDGKMCFGFANIAPLVSVTRGLTLSQACDLTGIEPTTVQNWIKRGWVAHPVDKRYGEYQMSRMIILNMLRSSMQLEKIAVLLRYVNGNADDRNDDIIPDAALYTYLCKVIDTVMQKRIADGGEIKKIADEITFEYKEAFPGAKTKLVDALTIMTLVYISAHIKQKAEDLFDKL